MLNLEPTTQLLSALAHVQERFSLLNPPSRQIQSTYVQPLESPREIARVQLALTYISADCDYETYRNVVWALMSTGWANAIDLARDWCMTCMGRYREHGFELVVDRRAHV